MISRQETFEQTSTTNDPWAALAAPLPTGTVAWRQDGRAIERDGKHFARFVAYVEANTVRERLDSVVPGEWNLTIELLPVVAATDDAENGDANRYAFKARLQILGIVREDVGTGKDYKQASTDAFKRAAVRFGIAHELYAYEQNWVQVDGDGKYAKPMEDPADAYARRQSSAPAEAGEAMRATGPIATQEPACPKCGGRMWDNRISKRNPKAPDFKCRSRSCDGVVWPELDGGTRPEASVAAGVAASVAASEVNTGLEELPF
jgi:hypothetical protein